MIKTRITDHVAWLTLARPEARNALDEGFWRDLPQIVQQLDDDTSVRVVVLAAEGPLFCAGLDLSLFGKILHQPGEPSRENERFYRLLRGLQHSVNLLATSRKPVLAVVQGGCLGGGLDLIAAADVRYATADAYFQIQEINVGLVADLGSLQRLPKLMPDGLVRELAYTGRRLGADEALRAGFVTAVLPDHAAGLKHAEDVASSIAAQSPLAVTGSKAVLNHARDHSIADGLDYVAAWNAGLLSHADLAAGIAAVKARKPASYDDLLP
jgi:enoyl-CoA hydratase